MKLKTTLPLVGDPIGPKKWYQTISARPEFIRDDAQVAAVEVLDDLWRQLLVFKTKRDQFLGRSLLNPPVPKGLYLWGGVGRGKSFLMDAFYDCVPYRRKRRIHFHNFMAEVHHEMKVLAAEKDPLISLADTIAQSTRLLCFDELHVSDIADAMILGRLLAALIERGVVLLITSNSAPDDLYSHGLQRQNFLPAIALLKSQLTILNVDGGSDYRLRNMIREPVFMVAGDAGRDAESDSSMNGMFQRLCSGALQDAQAITVQGRSIPLIKLAHGMVWFNFQAICGERRGQTDYLEIAHKFHTVFVSHIPKLTVSDSAQAQRLVWMVDVFYDHRVKLVTTATATPQQMFAEVMQDGEFSRTISRLTEMQSRSYLELPHQPENITLRTI